MFDTVSDIVFIILILAIVILIAVVWPVCKRRRKKADAKEAEEVKSQAGARGERAVEDALEKGLSEKYIFRDIVIDYRNFTHEIDFLVVTRAGVSVVEVKKLGSAGLRKRGRLRMDSGERKNERATFLQEPVEAKRRAYSI